MTEYAPNYDIRPARTEETGEIIDLVTESRIRTYYDPANGFGDAWAEELRADMGSEQVRIDYFYDIEEADLDPHLALFLTARDTEAESDRLVGMLHVQSIIEEPDDREVYWFRKLHVAEGTRGVGRALMRGFLEDWKEFDPRVPSKLEVVQTNARAIRFYERYGYDIEPGIELTCMDLPCYSMRRPPSIELNEEKP